MMELPETWLSGIRKWAEVNESVQEVWLFGGRASGNGRGDRDVYLAITLMQPKGVGARQLRAIWRRPATGIGGDRWPACEPRDHAHPIALEARWLTSIMPRWPRG
jgi:hypothetical protein